MKKVLFSWIGFKDLNCIAAGLNDDAFDKALDEAKAKRPTASQTSKYSPICQIVNKYKFDSLVLFFDLDSQTLVDGVNTFYNSRYDTQILRVQSKNVHSFEDIWDSAIQSWRTICGKLEDDVEPFFNLSSGTTSMNALFIVLGQISYRDKAKFIQVPEANTVRDFTIGYDLGSYAVNETLRHIELSAFDPIVGTYPCMQRAKLRAAKAAVTDCNVLIYGESGTGKELFAEAIHKASHRKNNKFKMLNCATLTPSLLESQLFGYVKGAFTDAKGDKKGLLEELDGGTLFLDEIEACPQEVQAKLLRVLQPPTGEAMTCRQFSPVGNESKELKSDVRIIAATNESLNNQNFRNDLLNRLSTLNITLPPLRERLGDIGSLAQILFAEIKKQLGDVFKNKFLCDSAIKFIETRAWKGNVRELKHALTQAVVFGDNDQITDADFIDLGLPAKEADSVIESPVNEIEKIISRLSQDVNIVDILKEYDIALKEKCIAYALKVSGGKKSEAAALLGISYQTMDNWKKATKTDAK